MALLAASACARITGSQASALTALAEPQLWSRCQEAFYSLTQVELPEHPPNRGHLREFRTDLASCPDTMDDLSGLFTVAAIGQARLIGNLIAGVEPDWSVPDSRHVIFGDGTIVPRYSDAELISCPVTGRRILTGSRAQQVKNARVQSEFRVSGADDKHATGINHVTLHTRTPYGLVVLAVGTELGAEQWTVLDLLDLVTTKAGDGIHTLVYDGALSGWAVEYAMARHGIQVMGKLPAASAKTNAHTYTKDQIDDYVAAVSRERGLKTPAKGRVERVLRSSILGQMYRGERPTAVGTSIYPPGSPRGEYELTYSTYLFTTATHPASNGERCEHTLVLDDGALFTVDIDPVSELLVKDMYLPAITSTRHALPRGRWGTTTTFLIPCTTGDFEWAFIWKPADTRYHRHSSNSSRAPTDPFGWRLRAVPRHDRERFAVVNAGRNDSESFNRWYKDTLPNRRAATINGHGQHLDLILGSLVKNCDTWSTFTNR